MKILHLIHDHPAHPTIGGGGGVRVRELAIRLTNRGHNYHIVSGWFKGCEAHNRYASGCNVTFFGPHRTPACKAVEYALAVWPRLMELAREADVVIEDFSPYSPIGAHRLQGQGKPVILQIQNYLGGQLFTRHGPAGIPLFLIEKWYPSLFRHHILVGDHLKVRFRPRRESHIVPNGFTMEPSVNTPPDNHDYIAYLGRFDFNQKGLDVLLEALRGTNLPVWFAGMGRETDRLQNAVQSLPSCRVLGAVHGVEKWQFLRNARFMALPSRFEGQPIVVIEAAAAGTPILASSIPELNFITETHIGRQFAPLEPTKLRSALISLWEDHEALKSFRANGLHFSSDRTWDHIADKFEAALEAVVANH